MRRLRGFLPLALPLMLMTESASAQQPRLERPPRVGSDTVVTAADSSHQAGPVHRFFFGSGYRDLWTKPIRIPVLDLARFDGGLRPTESGGGQQTKSLRLENAEGREWAFRSVQKELSSILPEGLRRSFVVGIVNDQVSHAHPGGALIVPPLASAIGVLHAQPQLAIMPDDPRLGEFREEYGGMLGIIEEFMDALPEGKPGFAGSTDIVNSLDLIEELWEDPEVRIDAHSFLKSRLLDFVLNDWDRHKDQFRWAKLERDGREWWVPIPRDRDNALFHFDGFFPSLARFAAPKLLSFGSSISLKGLTFNSRALDPAVLAPLDSAAWDSLATFVVSRLSDSLIRAAEAKLPAEYRPEREERVTSRLIARRNGLHAAAMTYYAMLARVVDVHGTDAPERARIDHGADGSVTVALADGRDDADDREPYFERRFVPGQTKEVRVYLHGGDDSVSVTGTERSRIVVRIIGGKGTNAVSGNGELARLYDFPEPPEEFTYGPDTLFDRRPWRVEGNDTLPPLPDRGGSMAPAVDLRYYSDLGLVTSVGAHMTRYGFRTWPHARLTTLDLDHAWGPDDTRFRIGLDFRREGGGVHPTFRGLASGLEVIRWYGAGNETVRTADGENNRIEHSRYAAELMASVDLLGGSFELGPAMQYARTDPGQAAFAGDAPYGAGDFGLVGGRARWRVDSRREGDDAPLGLVLSVEGSAFPAAWDADEAFGSVGADARTYLAVPVALDPVLALRAGGRTVFGTYPFFESAFLGGVSTLRAFDEQRFAGDAMAYGGAELRLALFRVPVIGLDFGVHGIADGGRVWVDGEESDEWHHAVGGGFSLGFDRPEGVLSVTLADSDERSGVYIELGFTF
jgi:hypothetical protein